MKKIYIKPESTVVALNVCNSLMQASNATIDNTQHIESPSDFGAREVIRSRGAWDEEW